MRRRASVLIYVLILMIIVTVVVVSYADLTTASVQSQNIREGTYASQAAADASTAAIQDGFKSGTIVLPAAKTYNLPGKTVTVTAIDNSSHLARTMVVTSTVTSNGKSRTFSKVVGKRYSTVVPSWYAFFTPSNLPANYALTAISPTRDAAVYVGGNLSGTGSLFVQGDLEVQGSNSLTGTQTVYGKSSTGATSWSLPTLDTSKYSSLLGVVLNLLGILTNIDLTVNSVIYANLSISLSGTISGVGTVIGNGLNVASNVTYANSAAAASFIVSGDITVPSSVTTISGFYYCTGKFNTSGPLTVNGTVVCGQPNLGGPLTINYDSRIWSNESLANTLKLPGPSHETDQPLPFLLADARWDNHLNCFANLLTIPQWN